MTKTQWDQNFQNFIEGLWAELASRNPWTGREDGAWSHTGLCINPTQRAVGTGTSGSDSNSWAKATAWKRLECLSKSEPAKIETIV